QAPSPRTHRHSTRCREPGLHSDPWMRASPGGAGVRRWKMKYMILLFGDSNTMMEVKTPEWIREMIKFMETIDQELKDRGEFVDGQGLVDPSEAKTVRFVDGAPVPTDGPFAEAKESLAR